MRRERAGREGAKDGEGTFEQSVGIPPAQSEPAAQHAALTSSASCAQLTTRPETESTSCSAARAPAAAASAPRTVARREGMVMCVRLDARFWLDPAACCLWGVWLSLVEEDLWIQI